MSVSHLTILILASCVSLVVFSVCVGGCFWCVEGNGLCDVGPSESVLGMTSWSLFRMSGASAG